MPALGPAARCLPRGVGAAALFAVLFAVPLDAALEAYYRINNIGSSTDALFANWQPVIGFSTHYERVSGASRPSAYALQFKKLPDKATPVAMQRVFTGTHSTFAYVYLRNSGESFPVFMLSLKDCVVTGYSIQGGAVGDASSLAENLSLNFAALEASVTRADSGQTLTTTTAAWNFSTGAAVTSVAPTLTLGATSLTTIEDTPVTLTYTHSDDFSDTETITRTASSSNPDLIAPSGLVFSGTGTGRSLIVTPSADASGTATITLMLRDTAGLTTHSSFALTVNPVNDPPVVAAVAAQTTAVGIPCSVAVSLSDIDTALTAVTLSATSDDAAVLPPAGIVISGNGSNPTLTLTPAAAGSATVTLVANDGAADSAPVSFTLIANPVGSGIPTDITLSAASVAENAANGTVVGTLGTVDADNAAGHSYALVDDAGGRFAIAGSALVVADGTLLDYETSTSHLITVRVTDPDGNALSKQLTIAVTNINEPPAIALAAFGAAAPGRALALTQISFTDPDAGDSDVRAEFSVLHGVLACDVAGALAGKVTGDQSAAVVITASVADLNAALAAGALSYVPAAGFTGDDILQVDCSDLGHTGAGGPLTDARLAAITVAVDSFAAWQALYFSASELADPEVSGPAAVPLGDGLTNLLKYALGLDPRVLAANPIQFSQTATDWVLTYERPASRPDLTYFVEVSNDLKNWSQTGVAHLHVLPDSNADTQIWRATYPKSSDGKVFVHLGVSLTSP